MHVLSHPSTIHMPSVWMVYGCQSVAFQEGQTTGCPRLGLIVCGEVDHDAFRGRGFSASSGGRSFIHPYGADTVRQSITRELGGCPSRKPKTADRDCESADTRSR